jgi:hypothetical protein
MISLLDLPDDCLERVISFLPPRDTLFSVSASLPSLRKTLTKDPRDPFYSACNRLHQIILNSLIQDIASEGRTSLPAKLFTRIFQADPSSLTIDTPDILLKIKMLWKACHLKAYRFDPCWLSAPDRYKSFSEFNHYYTCPTRSGGVLSVLGGPDAFCSRIIFAFTGVAAKNVLCGSDARFSLSPEESYDMVLLRSLKPSLTVSDYKNIFQSGAFILWGITPEEVALRLVKCLAPDRLQFATASPEAYKAHQIALQILLDETRKVRFSFYPRVSEYLSTLMPPNNEGNLSESPPSGTPITREAGGPPPPQQ